MTRSAISPATGPPQRSIAPSAVRRLVPRTAEARCALLVFVCVATLAAAVGRGERSGWILMTSPTEQSHASNTILGYSSLYAGKPLHKENAPSFDQIAFFHGVPADLDMYAARAVYAWTASFLAPIVGVVQALLLVNVVAWAAAAYIAWRLTVSLLDDRLAGLLAVVLVAGGMGFVAHIVDYSAHLLSFSFYYAGVLVLFSSQLWRQPRPLGTHVAVGCFVALATLEYNTGLLLAAAMVIAALGRQRWHRIAVAAAIALTAQRLWVFALNALNSGLHHKPWLDVYATENQYLRRALYNWLLAWQQGPLNGARDAVMLASEFLTFDSPAVVLLGGPAAVVLAIRLKLTNLLLPLLALPFASGLVWGKHANARGYLVYGASIILYVGLAALLASALRQPGRKRAAAFVLTVAVIGSHYAWSTAHLWGWQVPLKAYFLGWDNASQLMAPSPVTLSLTGMEASPIVLGGRATLVEAGAVEHEQTKRIAGSPALAFLASSLFLVYLAVVVAFAMPRTAAWPGVAGVAGLGALIALLARVPIEVPIPFSVDYSRGVIPPGGRVTYTIALGRPFVSQMARTVRNGDEIIVLCRVAPDGSWSLLQGKPRLRMGEREIPLAESGMFLWRTDPSAFLAALSKSSDLELTIDATGRVAVGGWQRRGLPGRHTVTTTGATELSVPAFEVRVLDRKGALKLLAF